MANSFGSVTSTPMGKISLSPLRDNASIRDNSSLSRMNKQQIVLDVFNMFDADGSGEIELDQMAKAFKTTGKLTEEAREQLKAHFNFMDADGSGEVTLDEFRAALGLGEIAFNNYQHQQAFHSLGLTLCQNLVVYRRQVLKQEFESMKQQCSGSGVGGVQDQFDCLVRALAMSTFALNLTPRAGALSYGRGKVAEKEQGGEREQRPERGGTGNASQTLQGVGRAVEGERRKREARALAHILKVGQSRRLLRPLPASKRRLLRAEVLAGLAELRTLVSVSAVDLERFVQIPVPPLGTDAVGGGAFRLLLCIVF